MLDELKGELRTRLEEALRALAERGRIPGDAAPEVIWQYPSEPTFGDLSTPLPFGLAKAARRKPREIAEAILEAAHLDPDMVERAEVAGPGYINLFISPGWWRRVLPEILRSGPAYGRADVGGSRRVQVEFVSANPTGPLTVGNGRGAALGDALANLLAAVGFSVHREYYINDAGTQMDVLGRSIYARYLELTGRARPFPEDGYQGSYIFELAREALDEEGERLPTLPEADAVARLAAWAAKRILAQIEADLRDFGVVFDQWFSERSLYERDEIKAAIELLRGRGHIFDEEGAVWLRSTAFGDDKDRVLIRSNGEPTYYASDVAYHLDKLRRGFETVIDIWGADHHGYVPRMKAAVPALGYPAEALQVLIIQLVRLMRGGEEVRMSKRTGDFVTLREVMEEVGRDAARYIFITKKSDAHLDFDLEVAKAQSMENPVYYVQYAHARLCSIQREAVKAGLDPADAAADLAPLALPEELAMMKQLARYPELVLGAARAYEPHRVTAYLQELAGAFHSYYNRHRILSGDLALSRARLALAGALRVVIANALGLLGVSAPERM